MRVMKRAAVGAASVLLVLGAASVPIGPASGRPVPAVLDGQLLYAVQDPALEDLAVYTVNPDGSHDRQVYDQPMECPHWSPDGSQIASCGAPVGDTTLLTVDTGATRFLPSLDPAMQTPCYVWSSDGDRLACEGWSDDNPSLNGLFTVRVRDWGDARRLTSNPGGSDIPGDYSPNSQRLVFGRSITGSDTELALFRINTNGTGLRRLTPPTVVAASPGAWSPQGNQILFSGRTDSEHRQTLWVIHADGTGLHTMTVSGFACGGSFGDPQSVGCSDPVWSPNGRHIAFRVNRADGTMLEEANADGSQPHEVADMGFDPGGVDWGTHTPATTSDGLVGAR